MAEQKHDYDLEALGCYRDEKVIVTLRDIDWFTPEFIVDVHENEPDPEKAGLGPFKDKLLGDFLMFDSESDDVVYAKIIDFLTSRMVGHQGHPFSLGTIPFADERFMTFAKTMNAGADYEVDRNMIWTIEPMLKCLIAPHC